MSFSEANYSGNSSFGQQFGGLSNEYALSDTAEKAIGVMYWLVFVIGTLGNLLVLVVLVTPQGRRAAGGHHATSKVFLMSLASADLLLHLISSWVEAIGKTVYHNKGWKFGEGFCKLNSIVRVFACNASICTLAAIAIERYLVISRHGKQIITWKWALGICSVIWLVNIALALPWFSWVALNGFPGFVLCNFDQSIDEDLLLWFSVASRIVQYFLPLLVTWLAYGGIIYIMYSSSKKVSSETSSSSNKSTWRVARMCLLLVLCFTITWTPMQIAVILVSYFSPDDAQFSFVQSLITITYFLASVNSCINPIVYATLWRPFKQALLQIFKIDRGKDQDVSVTENKTIQSSASHAE